MSTDSSAPTSGATPPLRTLHVVFGPEQTRRSYMKLHGLENRDVLHWLTAAQRLQGTSARIVLVDTYYRPSRSQWEEWERVEHVAKIAARTSGTEVERVTLP